MFNNSRREAILHFEVNSAKPHLFFRIRMAYQPRQVAPRALRRWLIEGGKLLVGHLSIWLLLSLLCAAATLALAASTVAIIFLSILSYLLFIAVAYRLDSAVPDKQSSFLLRQALPVALWYAGVVAAVMAVVALVFGLKFGNPWMWLYDPVGVPRSGPAVFGLPLRTLF